MKNKKLKNTFYIMLLLIGIVMIAFGFTGDDRNGYKPYHPIYKSSAIQESGKQGDAYVMSINNIQLPLNRKGIIADVLVGDFESGGQFGGATFLFSSGFFLSGFSNGQMWANAVASATLVEDYQPGTVERGQGDPNAVLYVLNALDVYVDNNGSWEPHQSWMDWKDAVDLGADFYDGDGDSVYTPDDKNQNGVWDPDEDAPDLLGDETVWCVYSDGIPAAQRRWSTVPPYGIEIRQTVFAFASAGAIGNLIFLRYRFKYVGLGNPDEAEIMEDVYFGVWADPDLGQFDNDVVGSDVPRNAGYTYDNSTDDVYGDQPPCYMIDFFAGPVAYVAGETYIDNDGSGDYTPGVDTVLDTAYINKGQLIGFEELPGAKNLPTSSFVLYINGDPNLNDPSNKEEARNYITGTDRNGIPPDPCIFPFGAVFGGVDCTTVDPKFWFSGDPVTNVGWIATINEDVRQMTNTGPFELNKGEENEITVAYVVGQGISPLDAITVARKFDDGAQIIFDLNFLAPPPPPATEITLSSSDDFIDIQWSTPKQIEFFDKKAAWDLLFHSYRVYAFRTNSTSPIVNNVNNSTIIAEFQIGNFIDNVYLENSNTGGVQLLYPLSPKLDSLVYVDPETGRIRVRVFTDPFNPTTKILKGTPYYFAVIGTAINYDELVYKNSPDSAFGTPGDYTLLSAGFVQNTENVKIISSIVAGENNYDPPVVPQSGNHVSGSATGNAGYDVIYRDSLITSIYEVTFFKDSSSELYQMYWRMNNITTGGQLLVDSSLSYIWGEPIVDEIVTEGFITKVEENIPTIGTLEYEGTQWFTDLYDPLDPDDFNDATGVTYVGTDILQGNIVPSFPGRGEIITGDRLRRVELRFGPTGKAYRYINGYLSVFASNSYRYAAGLTPEDTVGKGPIGNWDDVHDRPNGWVDVPFTAWIVDDNFGVEEQLAVGYVERARTVTYPLGTPDGVWDPTTNLVENGEIILIFDSPYDPNGGDNPYDPNSGGQIEFTGGAFSTPGGEEFVWADLTKTSGSAKDAPEDATNITEEQRTIFNSKWFNTLYVSGFQRINANSFYADGDKLIIPVLAYPYTEEDVYQFEINGSTITDAEEQELWNKVNVFPNPLYGFNTLTGFDGTAPDDPWVTFTNLPTEITVRIYSLSGQLLRSLDTADKSEPDSPFLRWDLQNENGLRAASGLYIAIVSSPKYGDKILKFTIIMPQKQIPRF